jgi:hypothetical protein
VRLGKVVPPGRWGVGEGVFVIFFTIFSRSFSKLVSKDQSERLWLLTRF